MVSKGKSDMSQILIDLREAYTNDAPSLPEIETGINQILRAAGRNVSVTVLRESLELVHQANAFNLINAIRRDDEEGQFLKAAFIKMAAPSRNADVLDMSKVVKFSDSAQDLFVWIINYKRQKRFDEQKLNALLIAVDAI